MKIRRDIEYALNNLLAMEDTERVVSTRNLAAAFNIPLSLLRKIFHSLSNRGLVEARRFASRTANRRMPAPEPRAQRSSITCRRREDELACHLIEGKVRPKYEQALESGIEKRFFVSLKPFAKSPFLWSGKRQSRPPR